MIFKMYRVASRIDVVCDQYDTEDSIKFAEIARKGMVHMQEIQIQSTNTPLPKQRIKCCQIQEIKKILQTFYMMTRLTRESKLRESQSWC